MAFFPCSNHHAPYRGPARSVYPAIVRGGEAERNKLRLCEECFNAYLDQVASALGEVKTDADLAATCFRCGSTMGDSSIFVTLYPTGEPPRNFYGRSCAKHTPNAVAEFLLK